jgi:hypothetical protein
MDSIINLAYEEEFDPINVNEAIETSKLKTMYDHFTFTYKTADNPSDSQGYNTNNIINDFLSTRSHSKSMKVRKYTRKSVLVDEEYENINSFTPPKRKYTRRADQPKRIHNTRTTIVLDFEKCKIEKTDRVVVPNYRELDPGYFMKDNLSTSSISHEVSL